MQLIFTKRSKKSFNRIEKIIEKRWGNVVASAFRQKVLDFFKILENYPEIGRLEIKEKRIYAYCLTKQTTIFYRIKGEQIIVLVFFDTRKNPSKRPK